MPMKLTLIGAALVGLLLGASPNAESVTIETASNHPDELAAAESVSRLIEKYELATWMFTQRILIDRETRIPHSHPVLTLGAGDTDDETAMLSTLVHEQIHWFVIEDQKALGAAIGELRTLYPDAPDGPPEGARDEQSTYLHLVVCALEYIALEAKIGREAAEKSLLSRHYYTWVFRTVVEDRVALREILERNEIVLP